MFATSHHAIIIIFYVTKCFFQECLVIQSSYTQTSNLKLYILVDYKNTKVCSSTCVPEAPGRTQFLRRSPVKVEHPIPGLSSSLNRAYSSRRFISINFIWLVNFFTFVVPAHSYGLPLPWTHSANIIGIEEIPNHSFRLKV